MRPDRGYAGYLIERDRLHQHRGLLIEVMPGQRLRIPAVGERVSAFGTWVYDTDHGWNEIHPMWAIKYLDNNRLVTFLPPATPRYDPGEGSGGSGGGGSGGGNCDPHYVGVCLHDGIGDYDCAGGGGNGRRGTSVMLGGRTERGVGRGLATRSDTADLWVSCPTDS